MRRQDRLANIVIVGNHGATIFKLHWPVIESHQIGTAALRIEAVTGAATQRHEKLLSRFRQGSSRSTAQPLLVLSRLHDNDRSDHSRVRGPAILGAEQVVGA